jgi:histidyl-tRNA synthetase
MSKNQSSSSQEYWTYPDVAKTLEIALYYGFTPTQSINLEKSDRDCAKHFECEGPVFIKPEEKAALIRYWANNNVAFSPMMLATSKSEQRKDPTFEYNLEVIGTNRSIADATLIKTTYEIVRTEGYTDINLEINSVGDRESFARYTRELTNYFRKHMNEIHPDCRQALKKNIYNGLRCEHIECKDIIDRTPQPMNYLSEPSRSYFSELLELLEMSDIPYTINGTLMANYECAMHTVFRIFGTHDTKSELIAYGSRWGVIAKKMGYKKDIQGMSSTIVVKQLDKKNKPAKIKKPQLYFIQMGNEAKLKSLRVIEVLRQSKIPVYHSLTKDKLTAQLISAENLKVPYILILGQKESKENTIVVREMRNRSQETIRMEQVSDYLKKVLG